MYILNNVLRTLFFVTENIDRGWENVIPIITKPGDEAVGKPKINYRGRD